jgi:hypothetical protein
MELVLAALVTGLASIIVALATRADRRMGKRLDAIEEQTATNGSNKTLGELAELMYADLQTTKRDLAEHQRRTDAHGLKLWERRK